MKTFKYPVISIHADLGKKDHILKDYVAMEDVIEMLDKLVADYKGNHVHPGAIALNAAKDKLLKEKKNDS